MTKKYYHAYNERYIQVHKNGFLWEETGNSKVISEIIKKYGISRENLILDMGVGEGRDSLFLLENGYNVIGIDCSEEAIKTCNRLAEERKIPKYDFRTVDIITQTMNEKFDFIYSIAVLHMLCTDDDRKNFFRFIKHHLTENGIGLISVMGDEINEKITDYNNAFEIVTRFHTGQNRNIEVPQTSFRMVTKEKFLKEISDSGLKVSDYFIRNDIPGFSSMMTAVVTG